MKITFVTYHNWEAKREGGFHRFAGYAASCGEDVVFFSFSRPYYSILKHEERLNAQVLKKLTKGCKYNVSNGVLNNMTWATLAIPGNIRNHFSYRVNNWFMCHSLTPFSKIQKKWLDGTNCFVFESCEGLHLLDVIKRYNPSAKIVYRPSDPVVDISSDKALIEAEHRMLLAADTIVLVNEESRGVYKNAFPDYDDSKAIVISNGVDLNDYRQTYPVPDVMKGKKTALYVGLFDMEWDLIIEASEQLQDVTFIIVNPNKLDDEICKKIKNHNNIVYVEGIGPKEVPAWVTNANIMIQPYPKNVFSDTISLSLTSKNYKAMAAGKPIIAYMIPKQLERFGLIVADDYQCFIDAVRENIDKSNFRYSVNLDEKDWNVLCEKFMKIITK